jgi:hypothetical protein
LHLSAIQGSAGQTVTETLYLDITDPNGIQLTALDEAIGFDAGVLRISNIRSAAALAGLGSYATASTADNTTGVLLVGQAFAGTGLPPVLPYGTEVAVLQFDVTLNADVSVGSVAALTLLRDGSVNGQLKYTAISDNEGALTFTPGMAPTNSGNAAIDGSVTVVPVTTPALAESVVSDQRRPSVVAQPRVVVPVRRVTPVSQPTETTAVPVINVSIPLPTANNEALASDTIVTMVTLPLPASTETSIVTAPPMVSTAPIVSASDSALSAQGTSVLPYATRAVDSGTALSLAALGSNKASVVPTITPAPAPTGRTLTNVLDEVYRQMSVLPAKDFILLFDGDDTSDEMSDLWDPES